MSLGGDSRNRQGEAQEPILRAPHTLSPAFYRPESRGMTRLSDLSAVADDGSATKGQVWAGPALVPCVDSGVWFAETLRTGVCKGGGHNSEYSPG